MSTNTIDQLRPLIASLTPEERLQLMDLLTQSSQPSVRGPRVEVAGLWAGMVPESFDIEATLKEIRRMSAEKLDQDW